MKRNLPDEILLTIFHCLWPSQLLTCQRVCRSWYLLANIKLFEDVILKSNRAIHQFIACFDCNRNKSRLKTVKEITLVRDYEDIKQLPSFDKETVEKLFLRFPNLTIVYFDHSSLIANFNEELCQEFLLRCPNLATFDVSVDYNNPEYFSSLVKVRHLLTNIQISTDYNHLKYGDPVQYITQFPQLKYIDCEELESNFFDVCLPIFEQLPNINSLALILVVDIKENVEDLYLTSKCRDLVLERLSNITSICLNVYYDNLRNTLEFIPKYLTGLESLELNSHDARDDIDQGLFCKNFFDVIPSFAKTDLISELDGLQLTTLSNNFSSLMRNMFQQVPQAHEYSNNRTLVLDVTSPACYHPQNCDLALTSKRWPFLRKVRIRVGEDCDIDNGILPMFESEAHMDQVDVFVLRFTYKDSCRKLMIVDDYLDLLETMPSLKKVELDVPKSFVETKQVTDQETYNKPVLPQVEQATLTAAIGGTMQSLLDNCCFAFPNLKYLAIYNFGGTWSARIGESQYELPNYFLQELTLDITPVALKMDQLFEGKEGFFVLEIEIQESSTRHLYKIPHGLSYATIIHDGDLKGFSRCKDYLRVRLIINYIEQVELRLLKDVNAHSVTSRINDNVYHRIKVNIMP